MKILIISNKPHIFWIYEIIKESKRSFTYKILGKTRFNVTQIISHERTSKNTIQYSTRHIKALGIFTYYPTWEQMIDLWKTHT